MQDSYLLSPQQYKAALHRYLTDPNSHGVDASAVSTYDAETGISQLYVGDETIKFDATAQYPREAAEFQDCGARYLIEGPVRTKFDELGLLAELTIVVHAFSLDEATAGYLLEYVMSLVKHRAKSSLAMPHQFASYIQGNPIYPRRNNDTGIYAGKVFLNSRLQYIPETND